MKSIELICFNCKKSFIKGLKEYNRIIKAGRIRFFCSKPCSTTTQNREKPPKGNPASLLPYNKDDEYSKFRLYLLHGIYRSKSKNEMCDLDLQYLKELWDKQNGICPFTAWKLILPKNTSKTWENRNPANASLDRINNSKGYIKGNVRFISYMANIARNNFSDQQLIDFCKAVASNE